MTSAGNRTSPVKRGKWILENLLGAPVPQPPPGVETNLAQSTAPARPRHRCASGSSSTAPNPSCAACHAVMDPIGFSLENFDLIGKWRDADGGVAGRRDGQAGRRHAARRPGQPAAGAARPARAPFAATATEKLLTYALGRRVEYFDMPAVRAIVRDAARNDYRFSSLVAGIVKSVPFQMKRYEGGTEP